VRQIEVNWISCHTGDALELRGWRVPFLKPALWHFGNAPDNITKHQLNQLNLFFGHGLPFLPFNSTRCQLVNQTAMPGTKLRTRGDAGDLPSMMLLQTQKTIAKETRAKRQRKRESFGQEAKLHVHHYTLTGKARQVIRLHIHIWIHILNTLCIRHEYIHMSTLIILWSQSLNKSLKWEKTISLFGDVWYLT